MASEYLQWKYRDVKPEEKPKYTKREKRRNWWHYHKWAVLLGAALLLAAGDIFFHALGVGQVIPDYQLAYVGSLPLSEDQVSRLEGVLASLGEDCNGDGRIRVQVNSYADMKVNQEGELEAAQGTGSLSERVRANMAESTGKEAAQYAAAAQVRLMADLESCDSYFFLCQDPETLQGNYQILARADGELAEPGEAPLAVSGLKALREAGLDGEPILYMARRGFWGEKTCRYRSACDALWEKLLEDQIPDSAR